MSTRDTPAERIDERPEPGDDGPDGIELVGYDDDGRTVICDPTNPTAWIRSGDAVSLESRR